MTACSTVLVCRGCCCGTEKQPGIDHLGQLAVFEAAVGAHTGSRLRVTNCLGPCAEANVVAVRHRSLDQPGQRLGTTWFAGILDLVTTAALGDWIATGAAVEMLPESLRPHTFDPNPLGVTPDDELTSVEGVALLAAADLD